MTPGADLFDYGVCAKECPSAENLAVECNPASSCTPYTVYSTYYLFDYCAFSKEDLPASAQANWDASTSSFENSSFGSAAMEIYNARWVVGCSPLIAIVFTFGYIYFMDKCAYWLSWISVGLIQVMLIGTGVGCYFYRKDLIKDMTDE